MEQKTALKNIPQTIYVQIGDDDLSSIAEDFKELSEVSWCQDRVYPTDLEYRLVDAAQRPTVAPSPTKEIIPASLCPECNPQWRTMILHRQAADILECEHCGGGLEREVWKHYHKNGGQPPMLKQSVREAPPVAPNEKLYRWVKASERLPKVQGYFMVKFKGRLLNGYFSPDTDSGRWKALDYEWLEELEQATPVAEGSGGWKEKADEAWKWIQKLNEKELQIQSLQAENAELRKKNDWLLNRR